MGEAKRRRSEAAITTEPHRYPSGLTFAEIEELASEDPDDREVRLAHGFGRDDADEAPCRNGCGLLYSDVVAGKIRRCLAVEAG